MTEIRRRATRDACLLNQRDQLLRKTEMFSVYIYILDLTGTLTHFQTDTESYVRAVSGLNHLSSMGLPPTLDSVEPAIHQ